VALDSATDLLHHRIVTSSELRRWLRKQGCTFEPGKGGHLLIRLGDRKSVLPMHGSEHELPKWIVEAIKKQLGLR
jgi:mRNA interferase HicA